MVHRRSERRRADDGWYLPTTCDIATLTGTQAHHVKIVMDLYTGPHNDVVQVFIDDWRQALVRATLDEAFEGFFAPVDNRSDDQQGEGRSGDPDEVEAAAPSSATTWEDYYRFNSESNAGIDRMAVDDPVRLTRSSSRLAGRPGDRDAGWHPVNGNGFLIDNVTITSSAMTTLPTGPLAIAIRSLRHRGATRSRRRVGCGVRPLDGDRPDRGLRAWCKRPEVQRGNWRVALQLADARRRRQGSASS